MNGTELREYIRKQVRRFHYMSLWDLVSERSSLPRNGMLHRILGHVIDYRLLESARQRAGTT